MKIRLSGVAAAGALTISTLVGASAQAGYVVTLEEVGSDVVATGSGPIDLTGLSLFAPAPFVADIYPSLSHIVTGPAGVNTVSIYTFISGPSSFGGGNSANVSSGSGDSVGVDFGTQLLVPVGYISGSPLSSTATWDNQTFATLGLTPDVYEWTWGTGANQNFTLDIIVTPPPAVPEPSTWAMMGLGFAGVGALAYRGRRKATVAA